MTPDKETFKTLARGANVVPVYAQVLADTETPVSVFAKFESRFEDCFLFESAENIDNWGRYSFIGCRPRAVFTLNDKKSVLKFADGREVVSTSTAGLEPLAPLRRYEAAGQGFERLALLEAAKSLPWNAGWDMFCLRNDVPVGEEFIAGIQQYEREVTSKR